MHSHPLPPRASAPLKSALPAEAGRTLCRLSATKIFLTVSRMIFPRARKPFSCGRENTERQSHLLVCPKVGTTPRSVWPSPDKVLYHKANIIASKSYNTQSDYRFVHEELHRAAQRADPSPLPMTGSTLFPPMFIHTSSPTTTTRTVVLRPACQRKL